MSLFPNSFDIIPGANKTAVSDGGGWLKYEFVEGFFICASEFKMQALNRQAKKTFITVYLLLKKNQA
jgi:hypothetical protein